jgi:hypothetical protein
MVMMVLLFTLFLVLFELQSTIYILECCISSLNYMYLHTNSVSWMYDTYYVPQYHQYRKCFTSYCVELTVQIYCIIRYIVSVQGWPCARSHVCSWIVDMATLSTAHAT